MTKRNTRVSIFATGLIFLTAITGISSSQDRQPGSDRAIMMDPLGTVSNSFQYFPGTEALEPDEIRVTACGTGMPAARRGQAATCFLIELGNG